MKLNEDTYKNAAEKEISKCRPGDWNHALRVVNLVKKLGAGRDDLNIIVAAAYIHDIGWKELLLKKKIAFWELLNLEEEANENSSIYAREFLKNFNFTREEIEIILRLIEAADKHDSNEEDEEIIVDADNLSKLNIAHLKEKYKKSEWKNMVNLWKNSFPKRIKTAKGKSLYPALLKNLNKQIGPL